jgi:hypothetical protein
MKTVLAIVCSLMLVWTPFVQAQAPAAGVERTMRACCPCHASCCAAPAAPESSPLSTIPALNLQTQLLLLAPTTLAWTLPTSSPENFLARPVSSLTHEHAPLYERNCARLI